MNSKAFAGWILLLTAIFCCAGISKANGYNFELVPAQSHVNVLVTIDYLILHDSDSDSSAISGWLEATLDPNAAPFSTIHMTEMELLLTEQIDLNFNFGLWGSGSAVGTDIGISMYQFGPQVTVQSDGSFSQPNNLLVAQGTLDYYLPIIGGDVMDLSEIDPFEAELTGTVVQERTAIRAELDIDLEIPLVVLDAQAGTVRITGTVVAQAEFWSPADLNFDGIVNGFDFALFTAQWRQNGPDLSADLSGNQVVGLEDLFIFILDWTKTAPWYED